MFLKGFGSYSKHRGTDLSENQKLFVKLLWFNKLISGMGSISCLLETEE